MYSFTFVADKNLYPEYLTPNKYITMRSDWV